MRREKFLPGLLLVAMAAVTLLSAATAGAQTESTLYNFTTGYSGGGNPISSLVMDAAGNLYGTALAAGAHGAGEVFELSPNASGGWTETVLYSFTGGLDGGFPYAADVIFDASGNLYGTTDGGGTFNFGTVFKLAPTGSGWSESVLYSFAGGLDGVGPAAGLVLDAAGNLYGTTSFGGAYSAGTVFQLTPGSSGEWTETVIHTFNTNDGQDPLGGLVLDSKGNVFGVTQNGGTQGVGVVFELVPSSTGHWTEKILHSFTGGSDGGYPNEVRLIFDRLWNLYGTTAGGGAFQQGTVFSLSPKAAGFWSEHVLYSFTGYVAANPSSGLIFGRNGNLYGTCANGNSRTTVGAVFELSPAGDGKWNERNLHLFTGPDGEFPIAGLVGDSAGNLYGTAESGGLLDVGVVFEVTP